MSWYVYVLVSERATLTYVGIARDPGRRLEQHNGLRPGGAKSTRAGRPWRAERVHGPFGERSTAQAIEARVKRLRGRARLAFVLDAGEALGAPRAPVADPS